MKYELDSYIPADGILHSYRLENLISYIAVPPKCRFLQEPHGVTCQKTPFFIVTTVKTSNLTYRVDCLTRSHKIKLYIYIYAVQIASFIVPEA
jgi:hypothetical protein